MSISIMMAMIVLSSEISREFAANSLWLAMIPASIITVLFIQKVVSRLYDRLYYLIVHLPNDNNKRNISKSS